MGRDSNPHDLSIQLFSRQRPVDRLGLPIQDVDEARANAGYSDVLDEARLALVKPPMR